MDNKTRRIISTIIVILLASAMILSLVVVGIGK